MGRYNKNPKSKKKARGGREKDMVKREQRKLALKPARATLSREETLRKQEEQRRRLDAMAAGGAPSVLEVDAEALIFAADVLARLRAAAAAAAAVSGGNDVDGAADGGVGGVIGSVEASMMTSSTAMSTTTQAIADTIVDPETLRKNALLRRQEAYLRSIGCLSEEEASKIVAKLTKNAAFYTAIVALLDDDFDFRSGDYDDEAIINEEMIQEELIALKMIFDDAIKWKARKPNDDDDYDEEEAKRLNAPDYASVAQDFIVTIDVSKYEKVLPSTLLFLDVFLPASRGYPTSAAAVVVVRDASPAAATFDPSTLLNLNRKLRQRAKELIGSSSVFDLISYATEELLVEAVEAAAEQRAADADAKAKAAYEKALEDEKSIVPQQPPSLRDEMLERQRAKASVTASKSSTAFHRSKVQRSLERLERERAQLEAEEERQRARDAQLKRLLQQDLLEEEEEEEDYDDDDDDEGDEDSVASSSSSSSESEEIFLPLRAVPSLSAARRMEKLRRMRGLQANPFLSESYVREAHAELEAARLANDAAARTMEEELAKLQKLNRNSTATVSSSASIDLSPPTTLPVEVVAKSSDEWLKSFPSDDACLKLMLSERIAKEKKRSKTFEAMRRARSSLPAADMRGELIDVIRCNTSAVVAGETGSGKSTQVPQYILDDAIDRQERVNIVVTQPRRIAAMALAERVASERCEQVGRFVGYSIRLESKVSKNTRLLYCTTGVLLRRLQSDPLLTSVTHVVLDEVHERTVDGDFLLLILRDILRQRSGTLKLILMSATLNANTFKDYIESATLYKCPLLTVKGRTFPVAPLYLEDVIEATGYNIEPDSEYARRDRQKRSNRYEDGTEVAERYEFKKLLPRAADSTISCLLNYDQERVNLEIIERLIVCIARGQFKHLLETEGSVDSVATDAATASAILVFLPGMGEIQDLYDSLVAADATEDNVKLRVLPLHSALPSSEQSRVFERPPPGVTKVVLATNIAETSITIDDIVYVVDCGKAKQKGYDGVNHVENLLEAWCARASSLQRRGRAGRCRNGLAFHLFLSTRQLRPFEIPEIRRVPLHSLSLQILRLELGTIRDVLLNYFLDSPGKNLVDEAIRSLQALGAIAHNELLTPLGYHLSSLPVEPRIGKLLILGAFFHCVGSIATIAAALSQRSPFVAPFDRRDAADRSKLKHAGTSGSDHIATLRAYEGYLEAAKQKRDAGWCRANFISRPGIQMIGELRRQFLRLLSGEEIGFIDTKDADETGLYHENNRNLRLISAVIAASASPSLAFIQPNKAQSSFTLIEHPSRAVKVTSTGGGGGLQLHRASVNGAVPLSSLPHRWLAYFEKLSTERSTTLRDSTIVHPIDLLLFCGRRVVYDDERECVVVDDGWIQVRAPAGVGVVVRELRRALDVMLLKKIDAPRGETDEMHQQVLTAIVKLINGSRSMNSNNEQHQLQQQQQQ